MKAIAIVTLAVACLLAACSKGEPASAAKSPDPAPAATPAAAPASSAAPATAAAPAPQPTQGLLDRLARQEAALKSLAPSIEAPAAKPPSPAKAAPPPAPPAPTPTPPAQARTSPPAKPAAADARPPATPAPAAAVPVATPPPVAAPAKKPEAAPVAAIAKAAPVPEAVPRVLTKVEPDFPREAEREGYDRGVVRARLIMDAEGNVTRVEIVEARPRRVFDRAVTSALLQWKFDAGRPGRAAEAEIAFRR